MGRCSRLGVGLLCEGSMIGLIGGMDELDSCDGCLMKSSATPYRSRN